LQGGQSDGPTIVERYLPAPPGKPEAEFYSCLSCSKDSIDAAVWDGKAFADRLEERVIAPAGMQPSCWRAPRT